MRGAGLGWTLPQPPPASPLLRDEPCTVWAPADPPEAPPHRIPPGRWMAAPQPQTSQPAGPLVLTRHTEGGTTNAKDPPREQRQSRGAGAGAERPGALVSFQGATVPALQWKLHGFGNRLQKARPPERLQGGGRGELSHRPPAHGFKQKISSRKSCLSIRGKSIIPLALMPRRVTAFHKWRGCLLIPSAGTHGVQGGSFSCSSSRWAGDYPTRPLVR